MKTQLALAALLALPAAGQAQTPPGAAPASIAAPKPAPLVSPTDPNAAILQGNVSAVEVSSFTDDARRPLRAGDVLKATLAGTPGGKATFSIPGVLENAPMAETSPGVYVGVYTVPRGAAVRDAAVLGKLVAGGVQSPLIQAPTLLTLDSRPPRITDFGPPPNAGVENDRPLIYGVLADGPGAGIDPAATRLRLDGRDVTAGAEMTPSLFTYKPPSPLASGLHTASVTVADEAGNVTASNWTFQVAASRLVQSFTTNEPPGRAVGAGAVVVFTLQAAPGGKASASLGSLARNIPLPETEPGVYAGEYTVRPGDTVESVPVSAKFTARDGTTVTKNLADRLTFDAGPPPAPRITEPKNTDYVDANAPLTIRGRGLPGSTIRVTVSYTSKVLGGILPVNGHSVTKDVDVTRGGDWEADDLTLQPKLLFSSGRDTVYTVSAVQLDASGEPSSEPATITVRPG